MKWWAKTLIGLVGVGIVGGAAFYLLHRPHAVAATSASVPAYLTSRAVEGTFTGQVSVAGNVQPSTLAVVQSPASGTVSTLAVQLNQNVAAGATIGTLSGGQTVVSPIAGTVIGLATAAGNYVNAGQTLVTVADTSTLYASVAIPEQFVREVAAGQTATVSLPALPGQTFLATVTAVGQQGTANSAGIVEYPASLKISAPTHILVGMSLAAVINTGTVQNAVYVPTAALVTLNGQFFVLEPGSKLSARLKQFAGFSGGAGGFRKSGGHPGGLGLLRRGGSAAGALTASTAAVEVPVKIGLMNLSQTQIVSGVAAGKAVLIPNPAASAATGPGLGGGGLGGGGFGRGG
ncbi:MAG: efflux RND transporter periplasmic adaptor subunit [Thermaerobacter sp.]|nr:efflux RND transporter periplasmic adaptor subunit [Thermaerobacter sp.]